MQRRRFSGSIFGQPSDVFVTGQTLHVDGGASIGNGTGGTAVMLARLMPKGEASGRMPRRRAAHAS